MTDVLALENLYANVVARFALDGTVAEQPFGWRIEKQTVYGPRIAWIPGDNSSGDAGRIAPPRNPGGNPRPLGTLVENFTCIISSSDQTDVENELLQYKATRLLYDAWFRAVFLAAFGTFTIENTRWLISKNDRRFGTALRVLCTVQAMIPDEAQATAPVDTSAVIVVSELDVTETQTIEAGDPASEDP